MANANKPTEKLIFDRELSDIENRTAKGYYNVKDLQRIQAWVLYLSQQLELGLVPHDFVLGETMFLHRVNEILDNIRAILAKIYEGHDKTPPTLPLPMTWGIDKANRVEKLLEIADSFVEAGLHDTLYANTFASGEFPAFRGDKPTTVPAKHTVRLVSLSGAIVEYKLNGGSWWRIPEYTTVFLDDGYLYNWEKSDGELIIDKGVFAVPLEAGISTLTAR